MHKQHFSSWGCFYQIRFLLVSLETTPTYSIFTLCGFLARSLRSSARSEVAAQSKWIRALEGGLKTAESRAERFEATGQEFFRGSQEGQGANMCNRLEFGKVVDSVADFFVGA